MPEPADRPPLRDEIAEALHTGRCCTGHIPRITDAVLHAIEPAMLAIEVDATQRADELAARLEQALDQIATERRARLAAEAAARRVRQALARKTLLAGPRAEKAVRVAGVEAALDAEQPSVCCDLHGLPCEPPSELCCRSCTEANHPQHPAGVRCVLDQPEETLMSDQPQLCNRGDGQPVSSRRVVLVGPDGTDRKRCGPYCDPCTDALLMNLKPTFTGGGAAYRIDREESR